MTGGLPRYSEYRPARLSWLGEIPAHWEEKRAKFFFREVDERSVTGEEELLSVSHVTGVTPRSQKNVTMFKAESYAGHKLCRPGDLVINTMWAWMAALGASRQTGIVSPSYGVYRPIEADTFVPEYVDALLRAKPYAAEYFCRSTGIRPSRLRLYPEKFLDIPVACPPRDEQERMVNYLRGKDVQIGRFIRNKRRRIELLNEQKQVIINRAVTRGLDPSVPLKPSGVDWLGDVPEHWEVARIKNVFREVDVRSSTGEGTLLTLSRHKGLIPHSEFATRPPSADDLSNYKICKAGHLIMNRMQAWSGMFAAASIEGLISPDYSVFQVICNVEVRYFEHLFKTSKYVNKFAMHSRGIGSGFNRLYTPDFGAIEVALPSKDEQQTILKAIEDEAKEIDATVQRAQREIELILECRTRLIADVVTGRVDVRHLAPMARELALDEAELLEDSKELLLDGEAEDLEAGEGEATLADE